MAGYRTHLGISGVLGVGYGVAAVGFGFTPVQGALAVCLSWVAGMLPDLDSQSGRPVRELFGLTAAVAPLIAMPQLQQWTHNSEETLLLAIVLYGTIRYGGALFLGKVAVHRGMFHSLPALVIAAEVVFLAYESGQLSVRLLMAGAVASGFLSHLILDECYSVEWTGIRLRLNQAAGSAVKLFGNSLWPNLLVYSLLGVLTYASLIDAGLLRRDAAEEPLFRQTRDILDSLQQPRR